MDEAIFRTMLDRLREGKMDLPQQDRNEIGKHARKHLPDLMEYAASLEAGYRTLTGRLSTYRNVAGERALGRIVKNQWSSPAALGYAAAALRQSGMTPSQVVGVLELMEELMDENPRAWAEAVYQEMTEDPGGNGGTGRQQARTAPGPRRGPAGRDGELRSETQAMPLGGFAGATEDGPGDPGGVRAGRLPALQKTGRGTRHLRGTRGTDCRGKRGGQGKREQRQQPGGLLRAVADGYAGSDNPCICADSGRPTPRNDRAGDGA